MFYLLDPLLKSGSFYLRLRQEFYTGFLIGSQAIFYQKFNTGKIFKMAKKESISDRPD